MLYISVFLTYHIHVRLNDHTWMVLIAGSGFFADQNVVPFILLVFQTMFFGKVHQIIRHFLFISRFTRDECQVFKVMKYINRFCICQ